MSEFTEKARTGTRTTPAKTGKYLTFSLGDESYGIGILMVKEIIGLMPITSIPRAPEYLKGVINLRGKVIPVIDLRLKFSMSSIPYSVRTCIIVIETETDSGTVLNGIVVDAVSEVLNISKDEIEETPDFGSKLNTVYILGMAKKESGIKILLDIQVVLNHKNTE